VDAIERRVFELLMSRGDGESTSVRVARLNIRKIKAGQDLEDLLKAHTPTKVTMMTSNITTQLLTLSVAKL